jgi:arginyl-tRNA--protein-N-Asp/Glu arginylyltransferase
MDNQSHKLRFFISPAHPCNYLDNQEASSLFADPIFPKDKTLYTSLVGNGFRRSGEHLYKPYCDSCSECIPVRIPVDDFKYSRNQKRNLKLNQDLKINIVKADFQDEHFQLYKKYIAKRHHGGGMDNPTEDDYRNFLWSSWSDTQFFEFRLDNKLISVAVVDQLKQAYSAVYTFFDPDFEKRSPGKYAILYLIEHAKKSEFLWLYLGYWIAGCQKMKYKIEYQPIECLINENWKKFSLLDFAVK